MEKLQSVTTQLITPCNLLCSFHEVPLLLQLPQENKTLTVSSFYSTFPTPNMGGGLPTMTHSPILWTQLDVLEFNSDTNCLRVQSYRIAFTSDTNCQVVGPRLLPLLSNLATNQGFPIILSSCLILCFAILGCREALAYVCWFVNKGNDKGYIHMNSQKKRSTGHGAEGSQM